MAFSDRKNNSYNNSNNRDNSQQNTRWANSRIVQLYSPTGGDASTISLGFWNQYVSIRINPILPESEREDGKMYDYDKTISCLLNIQQVFAVNAYIKQLEACKIQSFTFNLNDCYLKIGCNIDPESKEEIYNDFPGKYYLAIFGKDTRNNQVTGSIFYVFTDKDSNNTVMIDWDEESPKSAKGKSSKSFQFEIFKAFMKNAQDNVINLTPHYSMLQIGNALSKITNGSGKEERSNFSNKTFGNPSRRKNKPSSSDESEYDNDEDTDEDESVDEDVVNKFSNASSKKNNKKSSKAVNSYDDEDLNDNMEIIEDDDMPF